MCERSQPRHGLVEKQPCWLLQQPSILILDVASNQLDELSAQACLYALRQAVSETAVIAVTQQPVLHGWFDEVIQHSRWRV